MKLSQEQTLFTRASAKLIDFIYSKGYHATFGDAYRSPEQAAINAAKGIGIKDSLHCKRLAIDLNLFSSEGDYLTDPKDYEQFGIFWENLDPAHRWGGRFSRGDANHFERRDIP